MEERKDGRLSEWDFYQDLLSPSLFVQLIGLRRFRGTRIVGGPVRLERDFYQDLLSPSLFVQLITHYPFA